MMVKILYGPPKFFVRSTYNFLPNIKKNIMSVFTNLIFLFPIILPLRAERGSSAQILNGPHALASPLNFLYAAHRIWPYIEKDKVSFYQINVLIPNNVALTG